MVEIKIQNPNYKKPKRWGVKKNKLFTYQVGFTSPPHDFDAAPSDFLRISPDHIGAHGRMLHVPDYAHQLSQRVDNFHLLEDVVHAMANNGADAVGQVGTNWVHASGTTPAEIASYCQQISDIYETPFHMAGYCLVEALREMNIEKIALNSVYYWPDWRDGIARFLKEAGFDLLYVGNFVDLGFFDTQEEVNDQIWIFDGDLVQKSMQRLAERAPQAEALVVNGMPNFRRAADQLPQRMVSLEGALEADLNLPVISSDSALYWRIFKSLGTRPATDKILSRLLSSL